MVTPSVPLSVWLLAAFDPFLIAVAVYLGWNATQAGKVFIAAIAALAVSLLAGALLGLIGVPWLAPVGRDYPSLVPVRAVSALVYAGAAFAARRLLKR